MFSADHRHALGIGILLQLLTVLTGAYVVQCYSQKLFNIGLHLSVNGELDRATFLGTIFMRVFNCSGVLSRRGPQLGVAFVGIYAFLFSIASVLLLRRYGRRQVLVFGFGALAVIAWLFGFSFGVKDPVLI